MAKHSRTPGLAAALRKVPPLQLAAALGISPEAIYQWRDVPLRRVHDIARITRLSPKVLRPDFFGQPPRRRRDERAAA